ncbi:L-histidine N(alpha)-methyltransferase [Actinoplanes oblitus]|uniref:L-histidine N(Alpha)-methyltransferase n=1 Tax=Actinoplanes oblitus TaxID=3040509 RepID=A0ABY8WI38_9ACTN|nr:L-histidine N(alpha)-methyltransferase [Actinoplanes oblitus]WIM97082.1 L-histidine N(alpha)-methyltransferase [Actinoplanes oblitus]
MMDADELHRLFSEQQLTVLVDALREHAEFPKELGYIAGADRWRQADEAPSADSAPPVRDFHSLLGDHLDQVLAGLPAGQPVEVVDLGPGTGLPVLGLLRRLLDADRLAGYRGMDVSPDMLGFAGSRLRAEFPAQAGRFAFLVGDFTGPDLYRALPRETAGGPPRLVILAGATLGNLADPEHFLRRVGAALTPRDVLLVTLRFDTGAHRPAFMDRPEVGCAIPPHHRAGVDLLGIDPAAYQAERGFDADRGEIFIRLRFVRPVTLEFGDRGTVGFGPGSTVLLYRYRYLDRSGWLDIIGRAGLETRLFQVGGSGEVALIVVGHPLT